VKQHNCKTIPLPTSISRHRDWLIANLSKAHIS
jgi:hypothetical protein